MKRSVLRLLMAAGLIFLALGSLGLDVAYADYRVSRYDVTFEVVPNSAGQLRDVRVTLEVTYDVRDETKSSGFKFVGTTKIKDVSVTDGEGQPLEFLAWSPIVKHVDGSPASCKRRRSLDGPEDRVLFVFPHGKDPHIDAMLPHEHGDHLRHPLEGPFLFDLGLLPQRRKRMDSWRDVLGHKDGVLPGHLLHRGPEEEGS